MKRTRLITILGAGAIVVGLGALQLSTFAKERSDLLDAIGGQNKATLVFKINSEARADIAARESALVATTLGGDPETVDANLRSTLNQILAAAGVGEPTVTVRAPVGVRNPAARANELRNLDSPDLISFATITATAQARGTYEQVLAAIATVHAQPWAHRVEQMAITPAGKERERFDLEVVLTTMFFPGREPQREEGAPLWVGLSDGAQARLARLARTNPFTDPPVETVQAQPVSPEPPTAVGPAYDKWRVTALVQGRDGPEAWIENTASSERRTLHAGDAILDARFEGATGEVALVRIGGSLFEVALGRTLAERVRVSQ